MYNNCAIFFMQQRNPSRVLNLGGGTSTAGIKIATSTAPKSPAAAPKPQRIILPSSSGPKPDQTTTTAASSSSAMPDAKPFNMYEAFLNRKEKDKKTTAVAAVEESAAAAAAAAGPLSADYLEEEEAAAAGSFEASGVRPRKPCNCTKSQCLKL